jgi:hypothetical protein
VSSGANSVPKKTADAIGGSENLFRAKARRREEFAPSPHAAGRRRRLQGASRAMKTRTLQARRFLPGAFAQDISIPRYRPIGAASLSRFALVQFDLSMT